MKHSTVFKKFRGFNPCSQFKGWKQQSLDAFSCLRQNATPFNQLTAKDQNPFLSLLLCTSLLFATFFSIFPGQAFAQGEFANRVQVHFSKLKELDKLDKQTLPNATKIKLWEDFIILFPYNNPHLDEAKEIINNLSARKPPSPAQKAPVDQKIEKRFALLMAFEKKSPSIQKKIAAWSGFVRDFPIDNPKVDSALAKLTALRKEQKRFVEEKRLTEERAREEEARIQKQNRLAEEKKLDEEMSRREEQARLAEQKRLVEEEARVKEEERLVEKQPLPPIQSTEPEVARLEPNIPKVAPPKLTGHEGMVLIPAGKYVYGEPGSQKTQALNAFYMDAQEVTQKDYQQVMGKSPARFKGENLPVERVTWQEAKEYCKRTGKRLPTGKEWEKAARSGTSSKYYWGDTFKKNNANCNDCGSKWDGLATAPVRSFPPNAWKLYDMAGNVWEWVDESHNKIFKVLRGGSWVDDSSFISTAASYFILPENKSYDIGFRCAKEAPATR
jgi:formylglycine-generating enzyme required for sulfatase activity